MMASPAASTVTSAPGKTSLIWFSSAPISPLTRISKNVVFPFASQTIRLVDPTFFPLTRISEGEMRFTSAISGFEIETRLLGSFTVIIVPLPTDTFTGIAASDTEQKPRRITHANIYDAVFFFMFPPRNCVMVFMAFHLTPARL